MLLVTPAVTCKLVGEVLLSLAPEEYNEQGHCKATPNAISAPPRVKRHASAENQQRNVFTEPVKLVYRLNQ